MSARHWLFFGAVVLVIVPRGFPAGTSLPLGSGGFAPSGTGEDLLRVVFTPETQILTIKTAASIHGQYEIRIEADGLKKLERGEDVNEPGEIYLPAQKNQAVGSGRPDAAEIIFFFNDLRGAEDWDLVLQFAPKISGTWKLNGRFSPVGGELQSEIVIPVSKLEDGENLFYFRGSSLDLPKLYYRLTLPEPCGHGSNGVRVARKEWAGRVALHRRWGDGKSEVMAEVDVAGPVSVEKRIELPAHWWEDKAILTESALAVGRSLLHSQIQQEDSFFSGGFNVVYDETHRSYRMSHWLWAWGPSISFLLDLAKLESATAAGLSMDFRAAALAAGERSLQFGVKDPRHPAYGVSTVRWEPSRATLQGWAEYVSTADSLFLAGWGWMPLYRETNNRAYLERTAGLVAAAERLLNEYPVVPQDWIVERNRWTAHTLDESVFGLIGFCELYQATGSAEVRAAGGRYMDSHLKHMARGSGLLTRGWLRDKDEGFWDPDIKGHAWVMEGYLDAYRLAGDRKYRELALQLAAQVRSCQSPDGSWSYQFKLAGATDPADDKATAIWAYLFYELYGISRDPLHLAAARRALGWCLRHQYHGEDVNLAGAIFNSNSMIYVRRRPMTILYSTTFFGLALLKELALPVEAPQG